MKRTILAIFVIIVFVLGSVVMLNSCKPVQTKSELNTLTDKEKTEGWVLLFDGKTTQGWRGYNKPAFPDSGWVIENGILHCIGSGRGEAGGKGGDIIFDKKFHNFELSLEWKTSPGGNSGIFYLATELPEKPIYYAACEYQLLDNIKHPDGRDSIHCAGSLYDLMPVGKDIVKPVGEWNEARIFVYQGAVEHWLNGKKLFVYHLWTPEWKAKVAKSKFPALNPNYENIAEEGFIGLQDHGCDFWFRNIKIKEIK